MCKSTKTEPLSGFCEPSFVPSPRSPRLPRGCSVAPALLVFARRSSRANCPSLSWTRVAECFQEAVGETKKKKGKKKKKSSSSVSLVILFFLLGSDCVSLPPAGRRQGDGAEPLRAVAGGGGGAGEPHLPHPRGHELRAGGRPPRQLHHRLHDAVRLRQPAAQPERPGSRCCR